MTIKPLAGVRVLDFTAMPPGGACTVMLADLGAEIIRVESPSQKGKPSLVIGQVPLSRGKKSMTLDTRNPQSNDILKRMAPSVDVVVENAKPGSMEARGFGYKQARALNPKIVWCAITGFGQDGPYAEHAGHDLSFIAHSGFLGALSPDEMWTPGTMLAIPAGGHAAVIGIQAALLQAARTGEGAFVDISLSEAAGWLLTCGMNALSDKAYLIPNTPDRRLYVCADGRRVAVASAEPRTWEALCDGLDLPELKGTLHKPAHAEEATMAVAAALLKRPAAEWVEFLTAKGAAVTIVNRGAQVLDDPHVKARGSVVQVAGVPTPSNPVRLSTPVGKSATSTEPPHLVGQDTNDVLSASGFSESEIVELEKAGLI